MARTESVAIRSLLSLGELVVAPALIDRGSLGAEEVERDAAGDLDQRVEALQQDADDEELVDPLAFVRMIGQPTEPR